MMKGIKELREENRRLKKMYAEEKLKAEIVQEALEKKVKPSRRKEMAKRAVTQRDTSMRMAYTAFHLIRHFHKIGLPALSEHCGRKFFLAVSIPSTLLVMSISLPERTTSNLIAKQQACRRLTGVRMIHFINTVHRILTGTASTVYRG